MKIVETYFVLEIGSSFGDKIETIKKVHLLKSGKLIMESINGRGLITYKPITVELFGKMVSQLEEYLNR